MTKENNKEEEKGFHSFDRFFLYVGIISLTIGTVFTHDKLKSLKSLEKKLEPKAEVRNVIGGNKPDVFYNIDGKRVYLEIDGKPIENYFRGEGK